MQNANGKDVSMDIGIASLSLQPCTKQESMLGVQAKTMKLIAFIVVLYVYVIPKFHIT